MLAALGVTAGVNDPSSTAPPDGIAGLSPD